MTDASMVTMGAPSPEGSLQVPFDAAVIIPTILRDTLPRAVRSVFAQDYPGRIQILIGVDVARGDRDILRQLATECPDRMAITLFDPGYSTAKIHGGIYQNAFSGSLRTVLSYAANSRYLAYLDDDNWWAPHHLSDLLKAIDGFDWAFTYRWFVDPGTQNVICADDFESIGPARGIYAKNLGGFVDSNCLMIDKTRCHWVLPNWSIPLLPDGSGEDRNVFNALKSRHSIAWTRRPSVYYVINPTAGAQPIRDKLLAERGHNPSVTASKVSAPSPPHSKTIDEYFLSNLTRKLHLGPGTNVLKGWLNTDIAPSSPNVMALDLTSALPFENDSFDYIAGEHIIEHFTLKNGLRLLQESLRILKCGGTLRLSTPDIGKLLALYTAEPSDVQKRYVDWINRTFIGNTSGYAPTLILNNMFYNWGHRFIYDRTVLGALLQRAGFVKITMHPVGQSRDPQLVGIENHGHVVGEPDLVAYETMVVEGQKP